MNATSKPALTLLTDKDWNLVEGEACRVIEFTPMATIQNGTVVAINSSTPYASVILQCLRLPPNSRGFITHKLDFMHLWAAFRERGVADNEEVLIFRIKKKLKFVARIFSATMPGLSVMVFPNGAYELLTDDNHKPELTGMARARLMTPVAEWTPDVLS
jgi:hypothetical protein